MLSYKLITPPTVEPVDVSQLRAHLRMDATFTLDDAILGVYLIAARQYAEKYTRRAFMPQTWVLALDHFPLQLCRSSLNPTQRQEFAYSAFFDGQVINLPRPSCVTVDSVSYMDGNGTTQTLAPSSYYVDTVSEPARLVPTGGYFWPLVQMYVHGTCKVTFTAASFPSPNDVPQTLVMAILILAAHWYAHSEASSEAKLNEIPFGVNALLDMHTFSLMSLGS